MESQYLINRRNIALGITPPPEKKKSKPIAKRSEKMKAEIKKLKPAVIEYLSRPENQECKIKMKGCTGKALCVHHQVGRLGAKLHDQSEWVASCQNCNLRVEIDDAEARQKGFKKSRLR